MNSLKMRKSNIELCRIVCMFLIIMHHCIYHGGVPKMENCLNKFIGFFLMQGGKIGFITFLAISSWFMSDQLFKSERFLKTWAEVLFYTVAVHFLAVGLGKAFEWKNFFGTLLPITGYSHGFAASYMAWYLLLPFMRMISDRLTRVQAKWLVILLLYFQVFNQAIGIINGYTHSLHSLLLLFVMCYFLTYYLRNYCPNLIKKRVVHIVIFALTWGGRPFCGAFRESYILTVS